MQYSRPDPFPSLLCPLHRWPLSRGVNERQDPHGFAFYLVDQAIAFVRDQLAGASNLAWAAQFWMVGKPGGSIAEKLVHLRSGAAAVGCYV